MANEGGEPFGLDIVEGDPTFTFKASYVHEGTASGVRITSNQSISDVINGRNGFYVFSRERPDDSTATDRIGIDGLFRCTDKLRPALQVLPDLCSDDPDGVFIAENDWPMFARTIVPKLTEAGIGFDIPQEVTEAVGTECRIEFYLDRDLYGITCEAVAKYGDFTFQLVPTAKELRGVINPDSRSRASQVKRDLSRESFAVQVVRQLCPTWSSIDVARVKEEDEQAILLMLTDGVQILKSVGQVFSTAAFDGMMQPNPPSVKVGLSIDSNLVEISPIADEVPMNEVGALLDSYRRKRRYHRLKNGTFVDLKEADLHELDQVSTDLDLSEKQLDSGIIKIPGYQAFLLDSQVDDEGKSASFVDYVNDVKIVDPKRYEVPERLKTVLRPYQVEGFQWLSTLWDKASAASSPTRWPRQIRAAALAHRSAQRKRSVTHRLPGIARLQLGRGMREIRGRSDGGSRRRYESAATQGHRDGGRAIAGERRCYDEWRHDVRRHRRGDHLLRSAASRRGRLRSLPFRADGARRGAIHQKPCHKGGQIGQTGHGRPSLRSDRHANRKPVERTVEHFRLPHARTARHLYEIPRKIRAADHAPGPEHSVMADKLQALVGLFIKRRLKKDVLTDLPDKFENVLTVKLEGEQRKLYAAHEQRLRATLTKASDATSTPRRSASSPNSPCCAKSAAIQDSYTPTRRTPPPNSTPSPNSWPHAWAKAKKVLVFSQFTSFLELIGARLAEQGVEYYTITGETPKKRRVELVDEFNGNDVPVFLISLKAGNTGLNLVGASVVVHAIHGGTPPRRTRQPTARTVSAKPRT